MRQLSIGSRAICPGGRTFVIAEIGVNHDGSAERALELVRHAGIAGADAVKLQIFRASELMHSSSSFASYQRERMADCDPIQMLRRYELSQPDLRKITSAARELGLITLATPFSATDVEMILQLGLPAIKIASPDLVNRPLLQRAASTGRPMLVSTGAATMTEVSRTVDWLNSWNVPFALLHCISSYPVANQDAHLCWIGELGRFGVPVGYSDHTTDSSCGALAVAAGACVIEKHLTYDSSACGPDHSASADPDMFARYVAAIRSAETLRGTAGKRVLNIEEDVRQVSRQSLVLARTMTAGERITEDALTVQRPGTGVPAAEIEAMIHRTVKHAVTAGTILQWEMLRDAEEANAA